MRFYLPLAAACLLLCPCGAAIGQNVQTAVSLPQQAGVAPADYTIPALTVLDLVIEADLGSKLSKTGDSFPLQLKTPITIDGKDVLPAGTSGVGEVVHAKKAGGSGTPGELVLAARFLNVGDRQLRLRSLRIGVVGADKIGTVNNLMMASAVSPVPIALLGFAIKGGETVIAKGTVAQAKTVEAFNLPRGPTVEAENQ